MHTKGPWRLSAHETSTRGIDVLPSDGVAFIIASVKLPAYTDQMERRANARLIAASPELLEALTMIRDADEDCKRDGLPTIPPAARSTIDAAIRKAEGKE